MDGHISKSRVFGMGARIAALPILGLLALFLVKGSDLYLSAKIGRATETGQNASRIAWMMTERVLMETEFLNRADQALMGQIERQSATIAETLHAAKALDTDREMQGLLEEVEKAAAEHQLVFSEAAKIVLSLAETKAQFMAQLNKTDELSKKAVDDLVQEQSNLIIMQGVQLSDKKVSLISGLKELVGFISSTILNVNNLLASGDTGRYEKTAKDLSEKMKIVFSNTAGMVVAVNDPKYNDYWNNIRPEYEATGKTQDALYEQWKQLQPIAREIEKTNGALKERLSETVTGTKKKIERIDNLGVLVSLVTIGITIALLVSLSLTVIRSITRPIRKIVSGLTDVSDQVAGASNQVSQVSLQLSNGSSTQAASIEETSSSLEEMSSMTKQNAENAGQADGLMKEANLVVAKANESMGRLTTAMEEINKASEETSKIIKTIDEIAFQTNLLALNAAVEAARAGDAGAGFAVVADEVRNLAMRAAQAAKNTANLIEGTVKKVKEGHDLVKGTSQDFAEVAVRAEKVGGLVAEIAAASQEQSQGIEQVNKAVAEMDKVVQQVAANAEESSSASQEMNGQVGLMKGAVEDLASLVGGGREARFDQGKEPMER